MRPSILLGERQEHRPGERAGIFVAELMAPLLVGPLRKYRPIRADDVAAAMLYAANHELSGGVIESDAIARLAQARNGKE
jgi:nucleoside-diphosphate-sugar epimerase